MDIWRLRLGVMQQPGAAYFRGPGLLLGWWALMWVYTYGVGITASTHHVQAINPLREISNGYRRATQWLPYNLPTYTTGAKALALGCPCAGVSSPLCANGGPAKPCYAQMGCTTRYHPESLYRRCAGTCTGRGLPENFLGSPAITFNFETARQGFGCIAEGTLFINMGPTGME